MVVVGSVHEARPSALVAPVQVEGGVAEVGADEEVEVTDGGGGVDVQLVVGGQEGFFDVRAEWGAHNGMNVLTAVLCPTRKGQSCRPLNSFSID